ncbi:oxidase [Pyrenophora tritici-repentis]|nr:oxidase [Pyrenophora tritici-repentis]
MKLSLLCSATLFTLATYAFPTNLLNNDLSAEALAEITEIAAKITREAETKRQLGASILPPGFDADAQRISTTGKWRYIPPGPDDIRGPCPGLNVMANHGYLPRNGIASVVQMTLASNEVFGMGLDLSAFLSVYASVMGGNITAASIGGKPKRQEGLLGLVGGLVTGLDLLGEPQGLSATHNRFEADCSPTRADLYKTGDPVSLNVPQFEQLYAMPLGPNGYDLTVMHPFRGKRFKDSVATNGRYWAGPVTHFAINTATYLFTYHFFANHSAKYPEGYLNGETLKSFEGVTGSPGSFKWASGRERIPENWYRRAFGNDYGIAEFTLDAVGALKALPYMAVVGGNTGKPNTFTGVNIADLTGGVFNAETLLEGNNLMCFAFQAVNSAAPDILKGLLGNVLLAVQSLTDALNPILVTLACPQMGKYDKSLFSKFPGAGAGV